ncbi:MAG: bifunctional oligoribonuclease/PAP phosphatase NrnA [Phycisphaerae bacterium]
MIPQHEIDAVNAWLEQSQRPLLLSHRRPDGDALGALTAMSLALTRMGREPTVGLFDALPERFARLRSGAKWRLWDDSRELLAQHADSVVILDTCSLSQLEPALDYLRSAPRMLILDHHATRDPLGERAGDLRVFDESAAAACLIVAEWLWASGFQCDAPIAEALFIGIATDCGWFRYSNTDARTLRAAARLVECGVNPAELHRELYQQDPEAKLRLIARMLSSMELHANGRLAVLKLRQSDFAASGADGSMTEDLVNEAGRLAKTEATALFTEEAETLVRANFRSKQWLDVAELARRYGGGGHSRAAGARLRGAFDTVVPRIVAEIAEVLTATGD